jgi:light-regulated signal transduction histidine kinase (bacteriophytochrome)
MSQYWERKAGLSVEESDEAITIQLSELEEINRRLKQDLLRQQEVASQLAQSVQELETRNFEISVGRDHALAELYEWNRTELALRQKTEELSRSNQDLEQFASLAAHDLQEPLHSIQVFLDLLRVKHGSSLNEQGHGYLDRVTKAASRMQQLIEGLLLYSRIDAPDSKGAFFSLEQIVQEILSDLGAQIDELQAEIYVGDLPMIHGDILRIRQLLQNLLGNALKFHKKGVAPVLRITGMMIQDRRHTGSGKSGSLCQIEIQDQGIGIPEEHLGKIFGMFKRLHRKDEYEGTGIGLAVCQRIADQCGGAISVRSTIGEGSTFTVTLPA